jgi:ribosomal protein S18 acetylase RimI-like enzyme
MNPIILPIEEKYIAGFHSCFDGIAKEKKYLASTEAHPLESTRNFILANIKAGTPHFVAVENGNVIGWCDIIRESIPTFSHTGTLAMGLKASYRGQGIGRSLLLAALQQAKAINLEKVELTVFESNVSALGLYKKEGFKIEGKKERKFKVDGRYENLILMGLFL